MKCFSCPKESDKYVLFKCDSCNNLQCKECGGYTASEEKCFPLLKRKALLLCDKCQGESVDIIEIIQKSKNLKRENDNLKEKVMNHEKDIENLKEYCEGVKNLKKTIEEKDKLLNELKTELVDSKVRINQLNNQRDEAEKEVVTLSCKVNDLQDSQKLLMVKHDKLQSEFSKVKSENNNYQAINEILQKQLDNFADHQIHLGVQSQKKSNTDTLADNEPYNIETLERRIMEKVTRKLNELVDKRVNELTKNLKILTKPESDQDNRQKSISYSKVVQGKSLKYKSTTNNDKGEENSSKFKDTANYLQQKRNIEELKTTTDTQKSLPVLCKPSTSYQNILNESNISSSNLKHTSIPLEDIAQNTKGAICPNEQVEHWQTMEGKRKSQRSKGIICTGKNNSNLTGAPRRRWVYIGRIEGNEVTEETITEYLKRLEGSEKIEVKKLETKGRNSSFSVGVPSEELYNSIVDEEFWPQGVIVRDFLFKGFFRATQKTQKNP